MQVDARTIEDGRQIEADVCVIGSGAAGISLAREFAGRDFSVALLESGGLEPDPETEALRNGTYSGFNYPVHGARLRFFGGTTGHWRGYCRPLEPNDFEKRAWIPHSGWPITWADLEPYYRRANLICELGEMRYRPGDWPGDGPPFKLDDARLRTQLFQFSPPTRFGSVYRGDVFNAPNIRTFLYANAIELEPQSESTRIGQVRVGTISGRRFSVKARIFVVACGGLENPRLLLASNSKHAAGVGNQHDLVGRFFLEHPHTDPGALVPADPNLDASLYLTHRLPERTHTGVLVATRSALERERMAALSFTLRPARLNAAGGFSEEWIAGELADLRSFWGLGTASVDAFAAPVARMLADVYGSAATGTAAGPITAYALTYRGELFPHSENRVTLSDMKDPFEKPRVHLHWEMREADMLNIQKATQFLAHELGRAGIGRIQGMRIRIIHGAHHMGTTRMSAEPKSGVVNADCRVHGYSNLYIAGSSVFTTGGSANPTLTIVALALRLADHIKGKLA